ncbi:MAG: hypothetical protein IJB57_08605, partial [Clostridia bacterium]|nr:hypothetical protein [Clostridia bacterium]
MTAKKIIPKILIVAFVVAFGVVCACTGSITSPVGTLWSLFPPVVAIGLALTFQAVSESNDGQPLEIIFPETGSPYSLTGTAMIDGRETDEDILEV